MAITREEAARFMENLDGIKARLAAAQQANPAPLTALIKGKGKGAGYIPKGKGLATTAGTEMEAVNPVARVMSSGRVYPMGPMTEVAPGMAYAAPPVGGFPLQSATGLYQLPAGATPGGLPAGPQAAGALGAGPAAPLALDAGPRVFTAGPAPLLELNAAPAAQISRAESAAMKLAQQAAGTSGSSAFTGPARIMGELPAGAAIGTPGASAASALAGEGAAASNAARAAMTGEEALNALGVNYAKAASPAAALAEEAATAAGAAGNVAKAGRLSGALGKIAPWLGESPLQTLGKASVPFTLGMMGGGIIDNMNLGGENSEADRMLSGAARGAGIGGALGTIIPIPGVGTGAGALIGAGAGALYGHFFGDHTSVKDVTNTFTQALGKSGLDPDTQSAIMAQYNLQTAGKSLSEAKAVASALTQQASQIILGQQQARQEQQRQLALQGALAPLFEPYLAAAQMGATQSREAIGRAAAQIGDPTMQALYEARAANAYQNQTAGLAGLATQMANPQMAQELATAMQYGNRYSQAVLGQLASQAAQSATGNTTNANLASVIAAGKTA